MRKNILFLLCLFSSIIFQSCDHVNYEEEVGNKELDNMVLIYMVADNNLNRYSHTNMKEIISGSKNLLSSNKLLVYCDNYDSAPQLIEIYQDKQIVHQKVIKTYQEQNSASGAVLSTVINDAFSDYKVKTKGIILWSHGTAWLPSSGNFNTRSFGQDNKDEMEIYELKDALPTNFFDFIIFDACFMNAVEVSFELRNKSRYIIGSSTEIYAEGFPYQSIIPTLYSSNALEDKLKETCGVFYDYYYNKPAPYNTANVSLIKTERLDELSALCNKVLYNKDLVALNTSNIQPLYYIDRYTKAFYDFSDVMYKFLPKEETAYYESLLGETVIYKNSTSNVYSSTFGFIPIERYSGLSLYLPLSGRNDLNEWYKKLEWYKSVFQAH